MSTGASPVPTPVPEQPTMSYPARLANMFVSPSKVFSDLNRKPGWFVPFLVISIFAVFFIFAVDQKITFEKVSENQIKLNPSAAERLERVPPEQRQTQMALSVKITRIASYASPVIVLAWFAILAGILLGTFNFGLGAKIRYSVALAIVCYASIPGLIRTVLAIIAIYAGTDPDGFNMRNPAATNIGAFLNPVAHPVLYSIGTNLDIFMIWTLVLTAIGFSVAGKVKRSSAYAVIFGWFLVYMVVGAGWTAIFS